MTELTDDQLKAIAERLKKDVDAYCADTMNDKFRTHLGMSGIGGDCRRKPWADFRWLKLEKKTGRTLRLLKRGHDEEAKIIAYLRGCGWIIKDRDEHGNQYKASGVNGHYGGSCDGFAAHPDYRTADGELIWFVLEIKTSQTGSAFTKLSEVGMADHKPVHFVQASSYARKFNLRYILYAAVNKNDDDIFWQIVKADYALAEDHEAIAADIINSPVAPPKVSNNRTHVACRMCHYPDICHSGQAPQKNCRSCRHSTPVENKQWHCALANAILPKDFIPVGCDAYERIV